MSGPGRGARGARPQVDGEGAPAPWWRDREVLLAALSVLAFAAGLVCQWLRAPAAAMALFWVGALAGGSTFAPKGVVGLVTRGALGIDLLMTISGVGAIVLGHVQDAAALAFLYSISEALEDKAMDRARFGLRSLLALVPPTALVRREAGLVEIRAADLRVGDVLVVRAGERIATDGTVREGRTSLDTSAVTGESIPVEVGAGDAVSAGSIATSGGIEVEATAAGGDNSLTTMVALVERAQAEKGRRARLADRIARPLVPGVLVLALGVGVVGSLVGDPAVWITRALVVLVAASPCALAIAVPVTVVSAIGAASRLGVIIKSGAAFEWFGGIRHVAFDKTGTLTANQPAVVHVATADGVSREQVLDWAGALERQSTHPLAAALVRAAPREIAARDVTEVSGQGVTGRVEDATIAVGSTRWLDAGELAGEVASLEEHGRTVVIVQRDGRPVGALGVIDRLRPEAAQAVAMLARMGLGSTMLTGDNPRAARAIAAEAGIHDVRAGLRPEQKAAAVRRMGRNAPVAMIGDGINDAPALAAADLGIAMGATGSDAAIESADVAFTGRDLRLLPRAFAHTRRARRIMNQNIVLAILIIATLLPLAVTGVLGLSAVVALHEGAEVIVILNGTRAARTPAALPASALAAPRARAAGAAR